MNEPQFLRPSPLDLKEHIEIDSSYSPEEAVSLAIKGQAFLITDSWRTGSAIQKLLEKEFFVKSDSPSRTEIQAARKKLAEVSRLFAVRVQKWNAVIENAPDNGFLKILYPEMLDFYLGFGDLQELVRAWNYFNTGVMMPSLGFKLHPFYGTYLPSRMAHIELFTTWLKTYEGKRNTAVDTGCGSGILALNLARSSFRKVFATDINPNACESLRRDLALHPEIGSVVVKNCDLLSGVKEMCDLIVFNPPWVVGSPLGILDSALFYEGDLFERFFKSARPRLLPGGRVVMLFSSVSTLVQPDVPHPLEKELENKRFRLVQKLERRAKTDKKVSVMKKSAEKVELWELAVL
ncbi:methyltransferase [Myxococcota bacterium]|nr:methyltransferase [Myxococcota bacterium]MBU1496648.1 methyltransferase [Myxococcota bacterium]